MTSLSQVSVDRKMPHVWSAICREDVKGFTRFLNANKNKKGPVVLIVFDLECGKSAPRLFGGVCSNCGVGTGHCNNLYHSILKQNGVVASAVAFHIKCDESTKILQRPQIGDFPHVYDVKKSEWISKDEAKELLKLESLL